MEEVLIAWVFIAWPLISIGSMRLILRRIFAWVSSPSRLFFATYLSLAGILAAVVGVVEFSDYNFKGANDEPFEKAAEFLLWFLGAPIILAGPLFIVYDAWRIWDASEEVR
ncbi:hypothetical protein LCM18_08685 [Qipengyuania flava]|nr:hypothetical protein LCM18_08685 [Qipengyuania flava]